MKTRNLNSGRLMVIVIICFIQTNIFAQSSLYRQNPASVKLIQDVKQTTPSKNIVISNFDVFDAEYHFSAFTKTEINHNNVNYNFVNLDGFGKMDKLGCPALPAHNEIVMVPKDGDITVVYTYDSYEEFSGYTIYPALEAASDQEGKEEPEFVMNDSVYSSNSFFPQQLVVLSEVIKIREYRVALVEIRPVQYNPVTHKIRVYNNLRFQVKFSGSMAEFNTLRTKSSARYLGSIKNSFSNNDILPQTSSAKSVSEPDYLIITINSFKAAADSLALWRKQMGYNPVVISKASWSSYTEVSDTIHNRYNNASVHPDYFVILGDQAQVPSQVFAYTSSTNYGSDLYFACMGGTGDYAPEMAHGRISVASDTQAISVVRKIINYEKFPVVDANFYNKAMVCAYFQDGTNYTSYQDGYDDRRFVQTAEEIRNYLMTKGFTVNRVYEAFDNRNPIKYNNGYYSNGESLPADLLKANGFGWNGGTFDVVNAINAGRFLVMHRDHGYIGGYGWAHPPMVNIYDHINILTNGNKLPIVFSLNCYTGDFLQGECFAENFLRKNNGGAAGIFAHSCESFSGYNDALANGCIDAIWSSPGLVGTFGPGAGTTNPVLNAHGNIRTMGDVLNQSLIRMMAVWTSPVKWKLQHEIFHYFGDPATKIWTQSPTAIAVNVPDSLPRFSSSLTLNSSNCSSGLVTLIVDGITVYNDYLQGGLVNIPINVQNSTCALLTISDENRIPFIKRLFINNEIVNDKPTVQAKGITISANKSKSYSITINWLNGDGDFRLVKINSANLFTDPTDGTEYTADNTYQNLGEQVIYNGSGNTVTIYGLDEASSYWFRVYEYNNIGTYTLYQTSTSINNPAILGEESGSLPINLISFSAIQKKENIALDWSTSDEVNNNYFEVEYSTDNINFNLISRIQASSVHQLTHQYYFNHTNPVQGINYYRLVQYDFDGRKTVYPSISATFNTETNFNIVKIVNSENNINLQFTCDITNVDAKCKLIDVQGRIVASESIQIDENGNASINFSTTGISNGIYLFAVNSEFFNEYQKVSIK